VVPGDADHLPGEPGRPRGADEEDERAAQADALQGRGEAERRAAEDLEGAARIPVRDQVRAELTPAPRRLSSSGPGYGDRPEARPREVPDPSGSGASLRAAPFAAGSLDHSTVTLLARFRGLSMSQPRWRATW